MRTLYYTLALLPWVILLQACSHAPKPVRTCYPAPVVYGPHVKPVRAFPPGHCG